MLSDGFSEDRATKNVKNKAKNDGILHSATGVDYFLHTKQTFPHIYPFAIGKFFWDHWVVGNAFKREDVTTIDVTETVFAIHQDSPWYVQEGVEYDRSSSK